MDIKIESLTLNLVLCIINSGLERNGNTKKILSILYNKGYVICTTSEEPSGPAVRQFWTTQCEQKRSTPLGCSILYLSSHAGYDVRTS
jgi:hypothetical protein